MEKKRQGHIDDIKRQTENARQALVDQGELYLKNALNENMSMNIEQVRFRTCQSYRNGSYIVVSIDIRYASCDKDKWCAYFGSVKFYLFSKEVDTLISKYVHKCECGSKCWITLKKNNYNSIRYLSSVQ